MINFKKLSVLVAASYLAASGVLAADPSATATGGVESSVTTRSAKTSDGTSVTVPVPVVVLMPVEIRSDPNLGNGCWVRLFNRTNFTGNEELTVVGPTQLQSMKMPSGINWKRKAESLIVGPNARVTVYETEFFKNKTQTYSAGQKVDNLRKSLGIMHAIDSLQVSCVQAK